MKLPESLKPSRLFAKNRRGVALITVLTVMALTTILVLTFFTLATSEHRASNTYSQGLQAQQVAEQAVNMVIAQIREATVLEQGEKPIAWASQPGAIRLWEENGAVGLAYKLYSDDIMKTPEWTDFRKDFEEAKNWSSKPDHFVDLNEPVIRGEKVYYPIVHPAAATEPKWPKPLGNDSDGVEGFRFNQDGEVLKDEGPVGSEATKIADVDGHVAMPVRWIYQLADGTFGVLSESSSGGSDGPAYRFSPISGAGTPSANNQIVARFAFWADDETSKLNMNVHAGGLAWDTPKAGGELDMAMGKFQPAQKEWQRYPGHPATTHLSPALAPGVLDIVNDRDAMELLFNVVPRIVGGGSESGTRLIDTRNPKEQNGLMADTEPLFPSLDDVVMRSDRSPHEFPDPKGRPIPADKLSEYLERAKFFITVNSRAPETNLFNKPKIAMWPVYNGPESDTQHFTAFDRLIRYCASLGKSNSGGYPRYEYIFKREKSNSATYDYEQIPRNKELYAYLMSMMDQKIPGYGKSFTEKYGRPSASQLVTMMFDYIRSTNLHDDTLFGNDFSQAFQANNNTTHLTYTNPRDIAEKGFGLKGHGQVTPIVINSGSAETKGLGRFYSLSGADIVVTSVGELGFRANSMYPGVRRYRPGGDVWYENAAGDLYTNLPPLPPNVVRGKADSDPYVDPAKGNWPQWLKKLEKLAQTSTGPVKTMFANELEAAFNPRNWNWQLAFADPTYRAAVFANPSSNKFNQALISTDGCDKMRLKGWETPGDNKDDERMLQASFIFNMFCPSIGWNSINPDMEVHIRRESGMTFSGSDGTIGFIGFEDSYIDGVSPNSNAGPDDEPNTFIWATNWSKPHRLGGARSWGGLLSFGYMLGAQQWLQPVNRQVYNQLSQSKAILNPQIRCRLTPIDKGYNQILAGLDGVQGRNFGVNKRSDIAQAYRYDLVTIPFKVSSSSIKFNQGVVNFKVYNAGKHTEATARALNDVPDLVQEVTLEFPGFDLPLPTMVDGFPGYINEFDALSHDSGNAVEIASLTADPGNPFGTEASKANRRSGLGRGSLDAPGPLKMVGRMALLTNHWDSGSTYIRGNETAGDIVQSIAIQHGDMRLAAAKRVITPSDMIFGPHRKYGKSRMAHSLTNSAGSALSGYAPGSAEDKPYLLVPDLPNTGSSPYRGVIPLAIAGVDKSAVVQLYGDFDNGAGTMVDGPYINKPDEGNVHSLKTKFTQEISDFWESRRNRGEFPYFSSPDVAEAGGPAYFSPNRIVSGPGMFGSLPSSLGTVPPRPWQTLLFRPNVSGYGYVSHPGAANPPDHLLMDLFWMPVVEPYAISEPLSTAGKVNMNFEIVPFLHVHRDTALRGVFRSELMLCVPVQWHQSYKHEYGRGRGYHWRDSPYGGELQGKRLRTAIVEDATLLQFSKKRFKNGENIFRSATEICDIHLIPEDVSARLKQGSKGSIGTYTPKVNETTGAVPDMEGGKYWRAHALVGDNSRERPYTNIQTRLTTKSNTFQVHYRAQVIKQARRDSDTDYAEWRPYTDTIQAEYRGSSIVERFVDPNGDLPDFTAVNAPTVDEFYQFRVVNPRRFAP